MQNELLIIFARCPVAGHTKTRLIPVLGAEGAAALQREMAQWAIGRARELAVREKVQLEVRFSGGPFDVAQGRRTGGSAEQMQDWLGPGLDYLPQCEGDLGARMAGAFDEAFARGAQRAVLIGTDVPGITADLLAEAFDALRRCDVALGPAEDGGYYLIGLRSGAQALATDARKTRRQNSKILSPCSPPATLPGQAPGTATSRAVAGCRGLTAARLVSVPGRLRGERSLFEGIRWGASDVFERTLARARALNLVVHTLQTLRDVDRPEDLVVWEQARATRTARK